MKLVLAGSHFDFKRFIEILWEKDKDISNYKYVSHPNHIRGLNPETTEIIKLGSIENRPDREEILRAVRPYMRRRQERADTISRRESMVQGDRLRGMEVSALFFDEEAALPSSAFTAPASGLCTVSASTTAIPEGAWGSSQTDGIIRYTGTNPEDVVPVQANPGEMYIPSDRLDALRYSFDEYRTEFPAEWVENWEEPDEEEETETQEETNL